MRKRATRLASHGMLIWPLLMALPVSDGAAAGDAPPPVEAPGGAQPSRGIEAEIARELARQEELLGRFDHPGAAPSDAETSLAERADPRSAPFAPADRDLPLAIFERENETIPRKAWGNRRKLKVIKRSLDADGDGQPEQIRYFDKEIDVILRKEQDRDYDGVFDTWQSYENGKLVSRVLDTNGDNEPDVWERYADGRMTSREIDRDWDGTRDAFYLYEGDSVVEERHDANNDGEMDRVVTYRNRLLNTVVDDRDRDGRVDTWLTYTALDGKEVVARMEKDTTGSGKADVFETFTPVDGKPVIARREEDRDGDGKVDVTSIYKDGKLQRREIADPSLVPL